MSSKKRQPKREMGQARMLRMSGDLENRVRAYQKRLRDEQGIETSFSSAVRTLIEQGLKTT